MKVISAYRTPDNSIEITVNIKGDLKEIEIPESTWHKHLPKCEFKLISGEVDKWNNIHAIILQFDGTCKYITADLSDCFSEAIHNQL